MVSIDANVQSSEPERHIPVDNPTNELDLPRRRIGAELLADEGDRIGSVTIGVAAHDERPVARKRIHDATPATTR